MLTRHNYTWMQLPALLWMPLVEYSFWQHLNMGLNILRNSKIFGLFSINVNMYLLEPH